MHLREFSYALKAVAEVANAGEELLGSLDRTRSRSHAASVLVGVGVGVGLGALLFSETARANVQRWLRNKSARVEPQAVAASPDSPPVTAEPATPEPPADVVPPPPN